MSIFINIENVSSLQNLEPGEHTLWVKFNHEARTREALSVVVGYYHWGELNLQDEPQDPEHPEDSKFVAWRHATSGCLSSGPWAEYDYPDFEFEVGELKKVCDFIHALISGENPETQLIDI